MKMSKRHHEQLEREDGCRTARQALDAARRKRSPLTDPALRRLSPLG